MPEYTYRGDRLTDPLLKNVACDGVKWFPCRQCALGITGDHSRCAASQTPKCVRGKNGNMLVVRPDGTRVVVLGRQRRRTDKKALT